MFFDWAIKFLVVAIIAALIGAGGIAHEAVRIAEVCVVVALVLFLVDLVQRKLK
jgi:uncharacterized membrane protein YtjA (UPF0391 family)